jgi:hypothetical protein
MGLALAGIAQKASQEVCLNQLLLKTHLQLVFSDFVHPFFAFLQVVVAAADMCRRLSLPLNQSRGAIRPVVLLCFRFGAISKQTINNAVPNSSSTPFS